MKSSRRQFLHLAAGAAALPVLSDMATAQAYPTRALTVIVPFAAGGSTDVACRIVSEHMSRTLGQQLVVENATGAGGTIGSTRAMHAKADGYTLLFGHTGTHAFSVSLYPNLAYKPDVDFDPIGEVLEIPEVLVARKDFPSRDLKEFVAYARANPDKLNVAHAGVGSLTFAPKGVQRPILDKLTAALDNALDDGNVRKRLVDIGGDIPDKSKRGPQQLVALVKSDIARWTPIIKAANVKLD